MDLSTGISLLGLIFVLAVGIFSGALFTTDPGVLVIWLGIVAFGVPAAVRFGRVILKGFGRLALRGMTADHLRNRVRDDPRPAFLVLRSFYHAELLSKDVPA